jgi:hypothetical protein
MMRKVVFLVMALAVVGCGSAPPKVNLDGEWPSSMRADYDDVTRAWTRRGTLNGSFREGMSKLLDVSATFRSPEWRTAYVNFRAKREMMPATRKAELMAEQRAEDEKYYEVILLVMTHTFRENDLQKGKRSVWRLALVDASGKEVEPSEVESVRTPQEVLRAYYPDLRPQHEVYVARFPKEGVNIYAGGAKRFSLKMAGARGGVELIWKSK